MGMTIEQMMDNDEYRKDIDKKFIKRLHDDTLAGNLPWVIDPYFDYYDYDYRVDYSILLKRTNDDFSNYIRVRFTCYNENEFNVVLWDVINRGSYLFEDGYTLYSTSWKTNTDDPEINRMISDIYYYLLNLLPVKRWIHSKHATNVFYKLMVSYATGELPLSQVGEFKFSKRRTNDGWRST